MGEVAVPLHITGSVYAVVELRCQGLDDDEVHAALQSLIDYREVERDLNRRLEVKYE